MRFCPKVLWMELSGTSSTDLHKILPTITARQSIWPLKYVFAVHLQSHFCFLLTQVKYSKKSVNSSHFKVSGVKWPPGAQLPQVNSLLPYSCWRCLFLFSSIETTMNLFWCFARAFMRCLIISFSKFYRKFWLILLSLFVLYLHRYFNKPPSAYYKSKISFSYH